MTSKEAYIFIDMRHFERSTLKETLLDQANSLILPVVDASREMKRLRLSVISYGCVKR